MVGGSRLWLFLVGFSLSSSGGFLDSGVFGGRWGTLKVLLVCFLGPQSFLGFGPPRGFGSKETLLKNFFFLGFSTFIFCKKI